MALISAVPYLLSIALLLLFSAFFSGSETALFSLTNFQRKRIETQNPSAAKVVSVLLDAPRRTLATILIGNMLVNIAASSAATVLAISLFGEKGMGISIVFMTLLILTFGEVAPKRLAIRRSEELSLFCCRPLHLLAKILYPLRRVLRLITDLFITAFTFKKETKPYITQEELKALMTISKREGIIEEEEEDMIRTIFDFGERSISEIMTPRVDIVGCERNFPSSRLIDIMKSSKHTKIPVYEQTIDHIVGIVYAKEFMLQPKDDFGGYIRRPLYISEAEKINNLLVKFQSEKVYVAVVMDEFGGTAGLVTLEDLLEEIVGEIHDEYDKEEMPIKKESDGSSIVLGRTAIRDVNDELGTNLPTTEVTTINGLLLLLFGRLPRTGESVKLKNVEFHIIEVKRNMVTKAQLKVLAQPRVSEEKTTTQDGI